jgi:hypothetical protein
MPDDGGEVIVLWLPPERRAGALESCNDLCRIARPALAISTLKSTSDDRLNHLTDRETTTIAAIKRQ